MAPNSAYINAPNNENRPAITHTIVNHTGDPSWVAILEGFIKTPEPMILPIIIEVAAQKPTLLAREELVDMNGEDNKKSRQRRDFKFISLTVGFNPNLPDFHRDHTSRPDINFSRKD